jgi:hypothetical protein
MGNRKRSAGWLDLFFFRGRPVLRMGSSTGLLFSWFILPAGFGKFPSGLFYLQFWMLFRCPGRDFSIEARAAWVWAPGSWVTGHGVKRIISMSDGLAVQLVFVCWSGLEAFYLLLGYCFGMTRYENVHDRHCQLN